MFPGDSDVAATAHIFNLLMLLVMGHGESIELVWRTYLEILVEDGKMVLSVDISLI